MSTSVGSIYAEFEANTGGFKAGVAEVKSGFAEVGSASESTGSRVRASFQSMASAAAGFAVAGAAAAATAFAGLSFYALKLAADAEQAEISFTVMLGSAEKAKALMGEISAFAAATPFQTTELIDASKKLLAFGTTADQIIPTMRSLGDISAGLGIPLSDLADLYGKARVAGRLMAEDVNQLTGRGIPVIAEFARQFGVAESQVKGLVESGQIGFSNLQQALVNLTGEGGKFAGLMAAQSASVAGVFSTAQDAISLTLTEIGRQATEQLDLRDVILSSTAAFQALADAGIPQVRALFAEFAQGRDFAAMAFDAVLTGAEWAAKGTSYLIGAGRVLAGSFHTIAGAGSFMSGILWKAIDLVGEKLVKLVNLLPGVEIQWVKTFDNVSDKMFEISRDSFTKAGQSFSAAASSQEGIAEFFDGVRDSAKGAGTAISDAGAAAPPAALRIEDALVGPNKSAKEVEKTLDGLRENLDTFGQGEGFKLAMELGELNASPEQVAEAMGIQAAIDALEDVSRLDGGSALDTFAAKMERLNELFRQGVIDQDAFGAASIRARDELGKTLEQSAATLRESLKSPIEQYQAKLDEYMEMLSRGLLTQAEFDQAVALAAKDLAPKDTTIDAVTSGSAEAAKLAARLMNGGGDVDVASKQYEETKKVRQGIEQIARNTGQRSDDDEYHEGV